MKLRTKILIGLAAIFAISLLVFAAGPPPGTFLVPSFFTTNGAKIYGTNGITVSSNPPTGIYLIDGRTLTNGLGGNFIANLNGLGTNTIFYSTATNIPAVRVVGFSNDYENFALTIDTTNGSKYTDVGISLNGTNVGIISVDSALGFNVFSEGGNGTLRLGANYQDTIDNGIEIGFDGNTVLPRWSIFGTDITPGDSSTYTIGLGTALLEVYLPGGGAQAQINTKHPKFSAWSNGVEIVALGVTTNFDFVGFTLFTNADGKLSIGASQFLTAASSNGIVNIATNKVRVAPGAGTTVTTNYEAGGVTYQVNDTEVASTMVRTNFVLNQVYTNTSVQPVLIKADVFMITAAVSGDCALDLMYSTAGATGYTLLSRVAIATTLAGGLALPITNTIAGVVTNLGSFYFTNTSSGAGNSAGLVGNGTGQYVIIGGGAIGPTGPAGAAGSQGISLQTNAFGGIVGSASNLVLLANSNILITATNTASGNGTNSVSHDTAQPITRNASPTFQNIGITTDASVSNHLAIGVNNTATNYPAAYKTRFFALTNSANGFGDWMAGTPMTSRRNWFGVWALGIGVGAIGPQSAASVGSLVNVEANTNEWPVFSYSTGAANLSSNGIVSVAAATSLSIWPGKNYYFSFVGRISQMSTQRMWIGYTSATSATMGANSDTPTTSQISMIRLSTAAAGALTNWALVTCDGSACTATAAGPVSLTTTNVHIFEIMEDRANNRVLGYVDGIAIGTNTANLPISGMKYCVMLSTLEAVAKTFRGSVIYGENDNRIDGSIVYRP